MTLLSSYFLFLSFFAVKLPNSILMYVLHGRCVDHTSKPPCILDSQTSVYLLGPRREQQFLVLLFYVIQ